MNYRRICVFDFECDHSNPELANPTQIAALVLDPRGLHVKKGGKFYIEVKPDGIDKDGYITPERDNTIKWHCKTRGVSKAKLLDEWRDGVDEKTAWTQFVRFVNSFNNKQSFFTSPIPAGMNVTGFDIPIAKRLGEKYKTGQMFWYRDTLDIQYLLPWWFESLTDGPKNHKMDTLREYFGMSSKNAHNAMVDVEQEATVITHFLKLHRRITSGQHGKLQFKGAFSNG